MANLVSLFFAVSYNAYLQAERNALNIHSRKVALRPEMLSAGTRMRENKFLVTENFDFDRWKTSKNSTFFGFSDYQYLPTHRCVFHTLV